MKNCPSCNLETIEVIDGLDSCTNCGWVEDDAFEDCSQDAGTSMELQKSIADLNSREYYCENCGCYIDYDKCMNTGRCEGCDREYEEMERS